MRAFATCIHEAGHAVAAVQLRFQVLGAEVREEGDRLGATELIFFGTHVPEPTARGAEWRPRTDPAGGRVTMGERLRAAREGGHLTDARLADLLTICVAGGVAEGLASAARLVPEVGLDDDEAAEDAIIGATGDGAPLPRVQRDVARRRARAILRDRWPGVVVVALSLQARGALTGEEIGTLLAQFEPDPCSFTVEASARA